MKKTRQHFSGKESYKDKDKSYIIIVSDNYLYRRAIETSVLNAETDHYIVFNSEDFFDLSDRDFDDIEHDPGTPVLVLLSSSGGDPKSIQLINIIKSRLERSSVIILSHRSNPNHLYQCISQGAAGYLLSDATEETLLDTMRLVRNGQNVYPSQVGNLMNASGSIERTSRDSDDAADMIDARSFSARETQVLRCLTSGMSNKAISRALEMADATVKLTVRNMLVKIHVENRVQAAVWASENGFVYIEPSHSRQTVDAQNSQQPTDGVKAPHVEKDGDVRTAPFINGDAGQSKRMATGSGR